MDVETSHAPEVETARGPFRAGIRGPRPPVDLEDTGVDSAVLRELALKLAFTAYSFSSEWAAERLHLPVALAEALLQDLAKDALLEILGEETLFSHRYTISRRGAEQAARMLEVSGYIGAVPVALEAYTAYLEEQIAALPPVRHEDVAASLVEMVLEEEVVRVASLAVASGRSLFLYGPPGNGKTSLGRLLHRALRGEIWIPHAIGVGNSIIRVFDPLCHEAVSLGADESRDADRRWAKIRRPLIVAGGELTLSALDLAFIGSQRFYEAPLHMKSNGGLFLVDDFGRQRVEPHQLLNRWIVPLEHGMDHLSLRTGQQIQVPFRQMLVIATNLNPAQVTDAAFLRRMGYRAELRNPSSERYARIFELYSARSGMALPPGLLDYVLERYRAEDRAPRACEPRDLIDRVGDICRFEGKAPALTEEHVDLAWTGYFGNLLR